MFNIYENEYDKFWGSLYVRPSIIPQTHTPIHPPARNNIFKVSIKPFLEPYLENGSNVSR